MSARYLKFLLVLEILVTEGPTDNRVPDGLSTQSLANLIRSSLPESILCLASVNSIGHGQVTSDELP